jgi:AcrR family transcriptional regulator
MNEKDVRLEAERPARRRRSDGERSRTTILREAAQLATVEGINGLSISRLADAVGMSKSGLFAHFGSKQELQLATIETASALFTEQVIEPASHARSGLERLQELAENFLRHVEGNVYPGGCFFASVAAEMDTHPGPVRDLAIQLTVQWRNELETAAKDAQAEGAIDPSEDPEQVAFEINAYLLLANAQFIVSQEPTPINRARHALERRLTAAAPPLRT